jgi:hypothetical protein
VLGGVFISYRRDDSSGFARGIYDRLARRLGRVIPVLVDGASMPRLPDSLKKLARRGRQRRPRRAEADFAGQDQGPWSWSVRGQCRRDGTPQRHRQDVCLVTPSNSEMSESQRLRAASSLLRSSL